MRIPSPTPIALLAALLLAGCGNPPQPPAAPQEQVLQRGDLAVRATVMQTSTVSQEIANLNDLELKLAHVAYYKPLFSAAFGDVQYRSVGIQRA